MALSSVGLAFAVRSFGGLATLGLPNPRLTLQCVPLSGMTETVLLVVLTGLIGMLLVRAEGRHTLRKIQRKFAQGEVPTDELIDGGLLIAAGAFLLTPGVVTDLLVFLLVIPVTRYPIRVAVKKWVVVPYADAKTRGFVTGNVYTGGFPGNVSVGNDDGSSTRTGGDTYDVDEDAYDIDDDFDDRS
jgi:UPF0716 protein FxsA